MIQLLHPNSDFYAVGRVGELTTRIEPQKVKTLDISMVHLLLSLCNISRPGQDGECKSELFVHLANEAKVQGNVVGRSRDCSDILLMYEVRFPSRVAA